MQITKITENFYQVIDVFSNTTLQQIHDDYSKNSKFTKQRGQSKCYRLELAQLDPQTQQLIAHELSEARQFAETVLGIKLYENGILIWEDFDGYLNSPHKDSSINLTVNIQVYILPGDKSMGTAIIENGTTTSVPYEYNCGYLLIGPTKIEHGMTSPVIDRRMSVYQSYRSTEQATNDW